MLWTFLKSQRVYHYGSKNLLILKFWFSYWKYKKTHRLMKFLPTKKIIAYDRSLHTYTHHLLMHLYTKLNGMVHRAPIQIICRHYYRGDTQNKSVGIDARNWKLDAVRVLAYVRARKRTRYTCNRNMKKKRVLKLRHKNGIINSKSTFNNSPKSWWKWHAAFKGDRTVLYRHKHNTHSALFIFSQYFQFQFQINPVPLHNTHTEKKNRIHDH